MIIKDSKGEECNVSRHRLKLVLEPDKVELGSIDICALAGPKPSQLKECADRCIVEPESNSDSTEVIS